MITRWGEYEEQCEMEEMHSALKVEHINDYLFIDAYKSVK